MCAAHGIQWGFFIENFENKFCKSCENKKNRVGWSRRGAKVEKVKFPIK
jgi:hypothetical protein